MHLYTLTFVQGGLGGVSIPSHVFIIDNVPHDWLFDKGRVSAVVHHGGAGTTAVGLKYACPTVVVPFFGDQGFWGRCSCSGTGQVRLDVVFSAGMMIHKAGAGPAPIPHKKLCVENLRDGIMFAITADARSAASRLAEQIRKEVSTPPTSLIVAIT